MPLLKGPRGPWSQKVAHSTCRTALCPDSGLDGSYSLLWREPPVTAPRAAGTAHDRRDVGRLDAPGLQQSLVQFLGEVDESAVFGAVLVEVASVTPVHEGIDDAAITEEAVEAEAFHQERQDVLRPDPFEAFSRTVPVQVLVV